MPNLHVSDLINWIDQLGNIRSYKYYSQNTSIQINEIYKPEGPIKITRWKKDGVKSQAAISTNQLGTVASVFSRKPNYPIHFDKLFSAGGNSRSALETLLALTPHFFICYPKKANPYSGKIENNQKHIMWVPGETHELGRIVTKEYNQVISEVEFNLDFGEIVLPDVGLSKEFDTIEAKKTHTQMQVALLKIGNALNFNTWIANNDRSIQIGGVRFGDLPGVISTLDDVSIFYNSESKKAASLVDCIWISGDKKYIPAIIEVEHSTGVTSGLTRMLKLRESIPAINTSFTIVASNDLRNKVVSESNQPAFSPLKARYMAYSTVRELYGLIQRYNLTNVIERTFIEPFMEKITV
jgi:type II restriction enzyme